MIKQCDNAFVILGTREDPHVRRVADAMAVQQDIRLEVIDYRTDNQASIEVDPAGQFRVMVNGTQLPENVLIWDRLKIIPGTTVYVRGEDPASTGYMAREWGAFFQLMSVLYGERVVNSHQAKRCLLKPYQQVVASQCGLNVPHTLVTNNQRQALDMFDASETGLILKSLSAGKVMPARDGGSIPFNIMTMRIDRDDLSMADAEAIACCPHFFQNEINKDYELRVVMIDGHPYPYKIDSQKLRSAEVDWRKGVHLLQYTPIELPPGLTAQLQMFMSRMGFFSGSVDLIMDREGTYWFLECNQDGAWGWLDDLSDGRITEAFVHAFRRRLLHTAREAVPA
jgi:hypothetical protein